MLLVVVSKPMESTIKTDVQSNRILRRYINSREFMFIKIAGAYKMSIEHENTRSKSLSSNFMSLRHISKAFYVKELSQIVLLSQLIYRVSFPNLSKSDALF